MSDFKIESDIPIPEPEDPSEELDRLVINTDDPEDDEDPEIPGRRGRKPRCRRNDLHVWKSYGEREKCDLCGDIFPCMNEAKCWHFDCWVTRGEIHPWIADGTMVLVEKHGEPETSDRGYPGDREAEDLQEES